MTAIHISYSPFWQDGLFNDLSLALDPDTHLTTWQVVGPPLRFASSGINISPAMIGLIYSKNLSTATQPSR